MARMMMTAVFLATGLFSASFGPAVRADEPAEPAFQTLIPDALTCRLEKRSGRIAHGRVFHLTDLRSEQVQADLLDQNYMNGSFSYAGVVLGFSNECDNDYTVFLGGTDLVGLARGERTSITGSLHYQGADFLEVHTLIHCR